MRTCARQQREGIAGGAIAIQRVEMDDADYRRICGTARYTEEVAAFADINEGTSIVWYSRRKNRLSVRRRGDSDWPRGWPERTVNGKLDHQRVGCFGQPNRVKSPYCLLP